MTIFALSQRPGDPVTMDALWMVTESPPIPGTGALVAFFSSLAAAELFVVVARYSAIEVEQFMAEWGYADLSTARLADVFLASHGGVGLDPASVEDFAI